MKNLIIAIKGILYRVVGIDWIVSPVGETCCPVPIYFVEEE